MIVVTKDYFCYLVLKIVGPTGWRLLGGLVERIFQTVSKFPEFAFLSGYSKCWLGRFENLQLQPAVSSEKLEAPVLAFV